MELLVNAVSLFSGAGGFELGFERAGIRTVLQAERDPWCLKILRRHWPDVRKVSDVRDVGGEVGADLLERLGDTARGNAHAGRDGRGCGVDLIYGGPPCQPFSVAGKRAGDRDERNLWPEFRRVVSELRPRWVVAENVPGLLSIDGGRFFGGILDDLGELGFEGVAYAVLDARHFGVPQRRRRVFVVAGPSRRGAEQVLSLCEGCGGHPAPGGAPGEDVAYSLAASARGTGDGHGNAWNSTYVANPLTASNGHHGHSSPRGDGADSLIAAPIAAHHHRHDLDNDTYIDTAYALAARNAKGVSLLDSQDTFVLPPAGVRRLTPLECERLMGWPDDWTRYDDEGNEIADSHRYRMCGNGVVATVAEYIGRRLVAVDLLS